MQIITLHRDEAPTDAPPVITIAVGETLNGIVPVLAALADELYHHAGPEESQTIAEALRELADADAHAALVTFPTEGALTDDGRPVFCGACVSEGRPTIATARRLDFTMCPEHVARWDALPTPAV